MKTAFEEILSRRITPDTLVPQHDFLFRWDNQPCFARGELIALTGKAKSGKTYVCSMLMAPNCKTKATRPTSVRRTLIRASSPSAKPLRVSTTSPTNSSSPSMQRDCQKSRITGVECRMSDMLNTPIKSMHKRSYLSFSVR